MQMLNNLFRRGWSKKCWHNLLYADVIGLFETSKYQKIESIDKNS